MLNSVLKHGQKEISYKKKSADKNMVRWFSDNIILYYIGMRAYITEINTNKSVPY